MLRKKLVAVGVALAFGGIFVATDASAAHRGGSRGHSAHAGVRHVASGRSHVGYRGGYGYDNGYDGYAYAPGYYRSGPCLPVVGCI